MRICGITSHLPNEVIREIINNLSSFENETPITTLASCCLVSKVCSEVATPLLYRHIDLTCDDDTSRNGHHGRRKANGHEGRNFVPAFHQPHFIPQQVKYLRKYTKSLTISYHHHSRCSSHPSFDILDLPNLITLQLDLGLNHRPNHPQRFHTGHLPDVQSTLKPCPVFARLIPKILVFKNVSIRLFDLRLPDIPTSIYEKVRTLVFNSSSHERYRPSTSPLPFHLPNLPSIKEVYWLFDPSIDSKAEEQVPMHKEWYKVNTHSITQLILRLLLPSPDVRFSIVNVGSTILKDPNRRYMSIGERQDDIEKQLRDKVWKFSIQDPYYRDWDKNDLEVRMNNVRFMDLKWFVDHVEWWDWIEASVLADWKKVMYGLPK
ncbi:hypothetical protein I204_02627 [Kwoniella mangroviensis CBS 8886]|uniref:hypothetical protein n=1 Tax=Kwoniella mangroviensis CBS 8507 TaxID=1296122 RepID=UPI00080D7167|nr:uncharacterized protein I203_02004 [Kwoniella mangroviensis CBS 8507]OCF68621.1 hypothetical protein I203_02004 [Kwoniella mangroviensis CBS 8507]OCF76918.1 hypothetical protein I204_02627 [Kwoniella mangroviensis CBS 8886]